MRVIVYMDSMLHAGKLVQHTFHAFSLEDARIKAPRDFPAYNVLGVEELTDDLERAQPPDNPEFTSWARGRVAVIHEGKTMFPKSPVPACKQPGLPVEVYHTVGFDAATAWAATKAMSEGM